MITLIDPAFVDRLAKICGMFGSNHDGERAAAAAKADSLVRSAGLTWLDVIALPEAPPLAPQASVNWRQMAITCLALDAALNERERQFLRDMLKWRGEPTEKQLAWLEAIHERLCRKRRR